MRDGPRRGPSRPAPPHRTAGRTPDATGDGREDDATRTAAAPIRERCLAEALAIIAEAGAEKLSLREVARRLGISHQAPYKHFASRDDLLAELIARAFAEFAAVLEDRHATRDGDPAADLAAMGRLYMDYAVRHPLKYRLMFATPLPAPDAHPVMMANARRAFGLLCGRLASMRRRALPAGVRASVGTSVAGPGGGTADGAGTGEDGRAAEATATAGLPESADLDALFVWSTLHGLATILPSDTYATLPLTEAERLRAVTHCFARLGLALEP